ncbi:MAG: hypothetical protein H0S84_04805 [Bacteroidales bacterium]|jgi:hypothetical protein|nr:hypothetical protein [Bacteroidales bacterium]
MKTTGIFAAIIFQLVSVNLISAQWQTANLSSVEVYVDDIPFNTAKVVQNYYDTAIYFQKADPEAFVDDIPFNTTKVVANYLADQAINVCFAMQDEAGIQDIPFDTQAIHHKVESSKFDKFRYQRLSK